MKRGGPKAKNINWTQINTDSHRYNSLNSKKKICDNLCPKKVCFSHVVQFITHYYLFYAFIGNLLQHFCCPVKRADFYIKITY